MTSLCTALVGDWTLAAERLRMRQRLHFWHSRTLSGCYALRSQKHGLEHSKRRRQFCLRMFSFDTA